jgi:hypothetical protein
MNLSVPAANRKVRAGLRDGAVIPWKAPRKGQHD